MFPIFQRARNRNAPKRRTRFRAKLIEIKRKTMSVTLPISHVSPIYDVNLLPNRRKWTRENYRRVWEMGGFGDSKVELLFGEIFEKIPMNPPHATVLLLCQGALLQIFGTGFLVRNQMPIVAGDDSEPEPDLAVVAGSARDFLEEHPRAALLLVEVAHTTLSTDLGAKATLYAATGAQDYWVVDVESRLIYVHRNPVSLASGPASHAFQTVLRLTETDFLAPLAAPQNSIAVSDLLP